MNKKDPQDRPPPANRSSALANYRKTAAADPSSVALRPSDAIWRAYTDENNLQKTETLASKELDRIYKKLRTYTPQDPHEIKNYPIKRYLPQSMPGQRTYKDACTDYNCARQALIDLSAYTRLDTDDRVNELIDKLMNELASCLATSARHLAELELLEPPGTTSPIPKLPT